ncbi:MAG: hypothetical protein ACXWB0_07530 [Sulfuricurvum sp.]
MLDVVNNTYSKFQEVHSLLNDTSATGNAYFTQLSDATQAAYIAMNEGMCANTTVCHECAEHRDFLQSMITVVEELENGALLTADYREKLTGYATMVNLTLPKISAALASL